MMNFEDFIEATLTELPDYLPEKYKEAKLSNMNVIKANDCQLFGVNVSLPDSRISTTVYLEQFFKQYEDGMSMESILRELSDKIEAHQAEPTWEDVITDVIKDFESVKEYIIYQLLSTSRNMKYLKDRPHREVCDLSMVYHIDLSFSGIEGSIPISNSMMNTYHTDEATLNELAACNTERLRPLLIVPMKSLMVDMGFPGDMPDEPLIVITDENKHNGAGAVLYDGVDQKIRQLIGDDYLLIPSSIHEMLAFPINAECSLSRIRQVISDVNTTVVDEDEVLSGHIYDIREGSLSIIPVAYDANVEGQYSGEMDDQFLRYMTARNVLEEV